MNGPECWWKSPTKLLFRLPSPIQVNANDLSLNSSRKNQCWSTNRDRIWTVQLCRSHCAESSLDCQTTDTTADFVQTSSTTTGLRTTDQFVSSKGGGIATISSRCGVETQRLSIMFAATSHKERFAVFVPFSLHQFWQQYQITPTGLRGEWFVVDSRTAAVLSFQFSILRWQISTGIHMNNEMV